MTRLLRSKLTLAASTFTFLLVFAPQAHSNQLVWCERLGKYVPATYTAKPSTQRRYRRQNTPAQSAELDRIIERTVRFHNTLSAPSNLY
jgi:hypothetical protein